MPQSSLVYAVARTRVLEGKLLTQDRLRRMLDAQSAQDALRALQEKMCIRDRYLQIRHAPRRAAALA